MENIKNLLVDSTIHGLSHIATNRKCLRLFWIFIVFVSFSGAGILIYQSFHAWEESPISTTIETLPIQKITFPKVSVCPPKNTYTDLNYDLMMTENMTLDDDTKNELTSFATELLYDHLYEVIMRNMSKLEDNDRYYNWYHGYTGINLPNYDSDYDGAKYGIRTYAKTGTIYSQYFGDKFEPDQVEMNFEYEVRVLLPDIAQNNTNITLHFSIEKLSMKDLSSSSPDNFIINWKKYDVDVTNISRQFSYPELKKLNHFGASWIRLQRKVTKTDIKKQEPYKRMPGFKLTWHYSDSVVDSAAKFIGQNKAFVRFVSTFCIKFMSCLVMSISI